MIDDVFLAQLACIDIYNPASDWDAKWTVKGVTAALKIIDGEFVLCFEGSHTKEDFERDAAAFVAYVEGLGWIDGGMYYGVPELLDTALVRIGRPDRLFITGHSLGGTRTWQAARKLAVMGIKVVAAVAFAPARPGFSDFRDNLLQSGILLRGYHNHWDPIPDLPFLPYCQPITLTELSVPAADNDADPLFKAHHGPLYYQGVKQLLGATNG
jgi:hypothetical protein